MLNTDAAAGCTMEKDNVTTHIDNILREREKTHGDFAQVAATAQAIKGVFYSTPNWPKLTSVQAEGMEMIAVKLARILCGNPAEPDSYVDIMGYAQLIAMSHKQVAR